MPSTRVVIVGAGQAGLAVSHHLTSASIDHVLIERGRTAERWRSQRWDSLRLLTPNWMSRLPGWSYQGKDPGGFMPAADVVRYLTDYAESFRAPVRQGTEVRMVRQFGGRYLVDTDAGYWTADAVVIASGFADQPAVPSMAGSLDPSIATLTPDRYRNPADLRPHHDLLHRGDVILGVAGLRVGGHDPADLDAVSPPLGDRAADDVAVGHHADQAPGVTLEHGNAPAVAQTHQLGGIAHRALRRAPRRISRHQLSGLHGLFLRRLRASQVDAPRTVGAVMPITSRGWTTT